MSEDEQTLLMIKGAISELPADQAEAVKELAGHFRRTMKCAGEPVGSFALALVGAERQLENDEPKKG